LIQDLPPEGWRLHWQEVQQRGSFTIETQHQTKQGRVFPVEVTLNYLKFNDQEYNCAFARDISDRKRSEAALRKSEGLYRTLAKNFPNGAVLLFDRDLRHIIAKEAS
jgi:PAS domain-containing protein